MWYCLYMVEHLNKPVQTKISMKFIVNDIAFITMIIYNNLIVQKLIYN